MARYIDADALQAQVCKNCELREADVCFRRGDVMGCLADEIDAVPTVTIPQWISVKERLPNKQDGDVVLIIGANGGYSIAYTSDRTIINPKNNTAFFLCPNQRSGRNATYWMPLPEAPKENDNAEEA